MSEESTSPENDVPTEPPDSDEPTDPVGSLFDLVDLVVDTATELKKPRSDGRPAELFVRWRKVPGGAEITACTTFKLATELSEGEYEGRFR